MMHLIKKVLSYALVIAGLLCLAIALLFGYRDIPLEQLKEKYAQAPSKFIDVNGMNVHFRDEGRNDSIPIVLIHGTGASLHTFDIWAKELQSTRRIIRMDLPGYGLTGPFPNRNYSIKEYVNFIKSFLDKVGIKNCILGGNSLGGQIAWRFTTQYSSMVEKLILIDAAGYPYKADSSPIAFELAKIPVIKNLFTFITPKFIARSSVENVYADQSKVTDELAERYFELTLRPGNRQAFVDRFEANRDTTAYRQISNIKQKTLILWGEEDHLIPTESAYRFQEELPNDTLIILSGTGHVPMEENPYESLAVLRSFLTK